MNDIEQDLILNFIELIDIDSIEDVGFKNCVDLQIEDDETFVLSNGIISHNSAVKGALSARNPEIHGGFPLRGKPLNVNGESAKTILENHVLGPVMKAVGLQINEKVDRTKLDYGSIYLAHDMDQDGFNIGALMINFFHKYWPELFDPKSPAFIYVFQTPFIIASSMKSKDKKYWYEHNIEEFNGELYNKSTGWRVLRAKGLGTLTKDDWTYSLKHPQLYPILDDGNMEKTLDLIFNKKRADDRKNWISAEANE
jgi:DNA gyrase/topoisomerase IV subunit B